MCRQCGAPVGIFLARGLRWQHFRGDDATSGTQEIYHPGHPAEAAWLLPGAVEGNRMAVRRGPIRLCRADEAEAGSLVKRPGGPEVVRDVEEEVQVVLGGCAHRRFEQGGRDSLPPGCRDHEDPAYFRGTFGARRLSEDHVAGDRNVVRYRDPGLQDLGRPEPLGRVGGPVHGIAAGLVDGPQRWRTGVARRPGVAAPRHAQEVTLSARCGSFQPGRG